MNKNINKSNRTQSLIYSVLLLLGLNGFCFGQTLPQKLLFDFAQSIQQTDYKANVYYKNFRHFTGNLDTTSNKFLCLFNRGVEIDTLDSEDYYFDEMYYEVYNRKKNSIKIVSKEIVKGNTNYVLTASDPIDITKGNFRVSTRSFLSPFYKNATKYYFFNVQDDDPKNVINIIPKQKKEFTLSGKAILDTSNNHILQINLQAFNCKLRNADSIFIELKYNYINDSIPVLESQKVRYVADFYDFVSSGLSYIEFSDHELNEVIPKRLRMNEVILFQSDSAIMEGAEADSLLPFNPSVKTPKPRDNDNPTFKDLAFFGYYYLTKKGNNSIYVSPLLQMTQFDAYQGWSLDQRIEYKHFFNNQKFLALKTKSKYNISKNKFFTKAKVDYSISVNRPTVLSVEGGSFVRQLNDKNTSSYTGLILFAPESMAGQKVYHYNFIKLNIQSEITNGVTLTPSFWIEDRRTIHRSKDYPFKFNPFGKNYIDNFPFPDHQVSFASLNLSLRPYQKYFYLKKAKENLKSYHPVIEFDYRRAIPNIFNSEADYDKVSAAISQEFKINTIGLFSYKIHGEKLMRKNRIISLADWNHINGSKVSLFGDQNIDDLHLLNDYELDNEEHFFQINLKNNFNSWLTSKIPGLKTTHTKLIAEFHQVLSPNNSYSEIGVGVYNLFRFFNVNFGVASLNGAFRSGFRIGISIPSPNQI